MTELYGADPEVFLLMQGPLLAEFGRSVQHSRLPSRKNRRLSRRAAPDPKQTSEATGAL